MAGERACFSNGEFKETVDSDAEDEHTSTPSMNIQK
jgi:hypothetical protein